jgi:tetratricopeptide (TPR) repeat protein
MDDQIMKTISDLVSQGRWEEAYALLLQYANQQPNDPLLQYQLGLIIFNLGRFESAIEHFNKSLAVLPDNPEVQYQLGLALLKSNKPEAAMPLFRDACEKKSDFVLGHLHWGIALAGMGNVKGALEQFLKAAKMAPELTVAQYQAGLMNLAVGQFADALEFFKRSTQLDPNWAAAFIGLGQTYMAMGNANDAIACFATASRLEPEDNGIRKSWAATLLAAARYDDAIRLYQDIINLGAKVSARDRAMAYNDWGVALYRQERLEEAAEKLVQAADVDPEVLESRLNLGLIHMVLHEPDLAEEAFDKAALEKPDYLPLRMYQAIALLFKGKHDEALAGLAALYTTEFRHPDLDLWTGYACIAAGKIDDAMAVFAKVVKQDPRNYLALDGLGCCFAAKKEHEKALQHFGMCLNLKKDFPLGHLHAARSLEALGEAEAAKNEYAAAVTLDKDVLIPEKEVIEQLLQSSRFDDVLDKSQKLLTMVPGDVDARLALAKAFKEGNQHDQALSLLEQLLIEDAQNGPAYVLAGQIFLSDGRFVEADDMFRKASDAYEGDSALYYSWGKTLALLGLHELAIEKYEQASEIDPYDGDVYDAWGGALKHLGKFAEAAEVYKRASDYL